MRYFTCGGHLISVSADTDGAQSKRKGVYGMDKENFSRQVLKAESSLYHVAKSILHNDEDCADAIQNGILKAYEKLDTLRSEKYFKTWLTRIVINECYQLLRIRSRYVCLDDHEDWETKVSGDGYSCESEEQDIMEALMRLDEKYRLPIVLHEIEGYSSKEIGQILGLSETNVGNRLFRGKKMLRKWLEGEEQT